MRDNFIFYKSFYDAINTLGEKAQLKLYKAIMKMEFNCCENVTELEQLCDEIETELKQNRNVFAQFLLMKPHLMKSAEASLRGRLGGAPSGNKNAEKKQPKNNQIEREYKIEEEYNPYSPLKENNPDVFFDEGVNKCFSCYEENSPRLIKIGFERRNREVRSLTAEVLYELDNDIGKFQELCIKANELVKIADKKIDFKMMLRNYIGILNGKYKPPNILDGIVK